MAKGNDVILCGETQRAVFESLGYSPIASRPVAPMSVDTELLEPEFDTTLVRLYRDGDHVLVTGSQIEHFQSLGWSEAEADLFEDTAAEVIEPPAGLQDVLAGLDAQNKDQWTIDGLVKLAVVRERLGQDVTRTEIDTAWPGFCRAALQPNPVLISPQRLSSPLTPSSSPRTRGEGSS